MEERGGGRAASCLNITSWGLGSSMKFAASARMF